MKAPKEIYTEITVNASANKVWGILTDLKNYSSWNPFIIKASGNVMIGEQITNTTKNGDKTLRFKPKIIEVQPAKRFEWLGHLVFPGLFDGSHYFEIQTLGENSVKLIQGERFKGLLSGVIIKSIRENTEKGFRDMNSALKKEAEKMH
ncbi:MAG: SRPBCC domain-containing protein [Flavobacteriales bacterium]|nr:SRPBCC domain-containing protein [Flavobacteriales bacterium]